MTYAELFENLVADLPPSRGFSIEVTTWRHGRDPIPCTTWSIYLAASSESAESARFEGPTAESVYLAFSASKGQAETLVETTALVNPDAIEAVPA
jgi:hypothetical protein